MPTKPTTALEVENVLAVQRIYEAFGRGDLAAVLKALSHEVEWEVTGPSQTSYAGTCRGRDEVAHFFAILGDTVEILAFEPREFIAQGDRVVVLGYERMRVKATGKVAENPWVMVFTLREGQVLSFHEYDDTAAVAAAFGGGGTPH